MNVALTNTGLNTGLKNAGLINRYFPVRHCCQHLPMVILISTVLSACGSLPHNRYGFSQDGAPSRKVDHQQVANAVPKHEPRSKFGNPKTYVVQGRRYTVRDNVRGFRQTGIASWYGTKFHGHRTSSGEPYDMYAMTAAHKTLPLPSYVEVHNLDNDRKIIVRVNDRGPFATGRIIDLSFVAAKKLGITAKGTGRVEIRVVEAAAPSAKTTPTKRVSTQGISTQIASAEPTPVSLPAKPTTTDADPGQLYLQVGAFTDSNNATQLLNQLVGTLSENVLINRLSTDNYNVYRVRIGPLSSEADAERLRTTLKPLGLDTPNLVVE
jgi:rare lipoprotein A